ncbi:E3 ubiquitin-protein ligase TRIM56-like [Glandiceps talaboti]
MATGTAGTNKSLLDRIDEEHLTCQICLERLTDARVLPCQHYFCRHCLVRLTKGKPTVNCPTCRSSTKLPGSGADSLPKCLSVNAIVDVFQSQKADDSEHGVCDLCEERPPSVRCIDCAVSICCTCGKAHEKSRLTKGHKQMRLDEYRETKSKSPNFDQAVVYCDVHEALELTVFCITCQQSVCSECALFDHKGHEHLRLKDAVEGVNTELSRHVSALEKKQRDSDAVERKLNQALQTLKDINTREQKKVDKWADMITKEATDWLNDVKRQIKENKSSKVQYLRSEYKKKT